MHARNIRASKFFRFDEPKYYRFGLGLGIANILRNGFQLGTKKTLGKILQPINSYTRFPEYHLFAKHIEQYVRRLGGKERIRILDIGSPKCLGLYLAYHFEVEVHLTDIYEPAVQESRILWGAIKDRAKGKAIFSVQDGRASVFSSEHFHVVYSMSVIEHVEGASGDCESIQEMVRVLKSGGLMLVTVPFGSTYIEQSRIGVQGAARETGDRNRYFFQRIYAPDEAGKRIISAAWPATLRETISIQRNVGALSQVYRYFGTNLRAVFGCLNPVLSAALNNSCEGVVPGVSDYGKTHSGRDIYGDLFLLWEKVSPAAQS